jgi:3',5'-cyclic AMP phosphodiesterase CpdA
MTQVSPQVFLRIAQISDFHFTHITWNPFRLFSKRILGNLNWFFTRKNHFSEVQIELLPALFQELGVDLVLIGGDISTTSLFEEFEKGVRFTKKLSMPWIAIPGNHDCYTYRSDREDHFYRYFTNQRKEITHPVEFFNLKQQGIEVHPFGPSDSRYWVLALDTTRATNLYSSQGLFSEKQEAYLEEILGLIPENEPILLFNHYPFFPNDETRRNLVRGDALQQLLKRHPRIRIYLHGHTHRHTIADLQGNRLPLILDSGSCGERKNGSWNLIHLQQDGCQVDAYRWEGKWKKKRTEEIRWTRK